MKVTFRLYQMTEDTNKYTYRVKTVIHVHNNSVLTVINIILKYITVT